MYNIHKSMNIMRFDLNRGSKQKESRLAGGYYGKEYTPKSFAKELGLNMEDYVSLTSYTHRPFYSQFSLEIQDNWRQGLSYNLPIDELMEVIREQLR